jgi:adenine-specific DNA-methyltransferase
LFTGDLGFRVFRLDSTNIRQWEPEPEDLEEQLEVSVESLKGGRTDSDVLFELVTRLGLDLSTPIEVRMIARKKVHSVGGGSLIVCLDESLATSDVEPLGSGIVSWREGLDAVADVACIFRDNAFVDDVAKVNLVTLLRERGITSVRSI